MTQHTAGPWFVSSSTIVCTKEARVIAQCTPWSEQDLRISLPEAIVNARLIAAAPALLAALYQCEEALRSLAETARQGDDEFNEGGSAFQAFRATSAAIRKATGQEG